MLTFKLVENSFGVWWGLMNAAEMEIENFHGRFFFLWAVFCGFNLPSKYSDVHFQGLRSSCWMYLYYAPKWYPVFMTKLSNVLLDI